MKLHTTTFKEQIKEMGRELDSIITFGNTVLSSEQLNAVTPSFQSSILKSAMKQLDIDSNIPIPIGTVLNYKFGVKINEEYEYIDFGNYIVKEIEKQEDTMSYKITCYDKMLLTMKDYAKIPITYPITIRNYINSLCIFLGLSFANKNDEFANYDKEIPNELYLDRNGKSLGYTFRDVFDELAQVTASTICINNNDEVEIRYITDTEDTIDEEYLKNINVNFGEKYGKVNSIVLSRSGESDNIYLRDETSVEENGLTELKIVDNQIMNFNNRADYLPDILEKLNGLEYYINDFSSTGVTYYDICDRYNVKIGDIIYSCVMFNDEILITQGLEENIFTEIPEETKTDYKKASKTDRLINQTYLIVDKQVGEIRGVVEAVETTVENITTTTQTSKGGNHLYIEDAMESNALEYIVEGNSKQEISSQSANIFAMSDKTYRSHNVTCIKEYIFDGYNNITIKGVGGATYQQICFDIPSSLLEEGVTYYLGGMVESFTSPTTYAQIGINEVEISTGTRTAYAEANFTSSELNTNKSTSMTIQDLDTYRYDIRLYLTTNRAGTTDDTLSVVYKNLYLSKNNEYVDFVPNMPSPDYPSEIKTVKGIRNLCDGINQNYYLNIAVNLGGLATGNNGLVIPTNGKTKFTISTNIVQERYRVACINNLLQEEKSTTTAYNGVNKDGTNASITIDTTGYSYLIINATNLDSIMIEEGSIAHDYVPYGSWLKVKVTNEEQEQSTLIDMNKPNLFDKDNANILNAYFNGNTGLLVGDSSTYLTYIPCKPNTTYNIQKIISSRFAIYISADIPKVGGVITYVTGNANVNNLQFTTNSDANYLIIYYYKSDVDTLTEQEILDSIKIYEGIGTDDYYELSSMNDIKDILTIQNKQATINQKMGKIVLDGSEAWDIINSTAGVEFRLLNTSFKINSSNDNIPNIISDRFVATTPDKLWANGGDGISIATTSKRLLVSLADTSITTVDEFKTWLSENPVTVYYELAETQTIELGDFPIMLYNDINNVELISELDATTQITYLRNTPISDTYATNQRVDKTDSNLETTNDSLNQTKQDVESTAIDLHNNYYDKEQINSIITTTEEEITTLKQTVETNTSSTNLQISVIEEQLKNGITAVKTETGYTFDKNGLNISKTGSEMSSTLDNDGLSVKRDNTEVLTVRSAGVETENLKVRTYFTIGSHTRVEDYGNGTGFFHIGGV